MEEIIELLKEIKDHQMQTVQLARTTKVYKLADKALSKALNMHVVLKPLKEKGKISFEEWKKLNCKECGGRYYIYKDKSLWEEQLLKIYNKEVISL